MPSSDQGINQIKYSIIPRTLIFLFDTQGRVLLLKGSDNKRLWPGLYNGIGGHVEAGEDILEAACRELFEESGINNVKLNFCGQIMVNISEEKGVAIFIFRGQYDGEVHSTSAEGDLEWVNYGDLAEIDLVEDLPLLLPKIAAFCQSDPILIGKYDYAKDGTLNISLY